MGKRKLEKFKDNKASKFVIEEGKELFNKTKGRWKKIFNNSNPIEVELGCGYGEYTINLAKKYNSNNYIGIDIKGSRIWKGSKKAEEENLLNVIFLRIRIEKVQEFFSKNELSKIYIIFPDPRPKTRDINKRLVSKKFMLSYYYLLKKNGKIILKTDNDNLFNFCIETLKKDFKYKDLLYTNNFYKSSLFFESENIQTNYEKKYLSLDKKINYLEFTVLN